MKRGALFSQAVAVGQEHEPSVVRLVLPRVDELFAR